MNLKRQLLLVSLLTLVLPWAGCQFIRETETALRTSQQQMLAGTARTLAESIARFPEEFPAEEPAAHVFGDSLYGHRLEHPPEVDGYFDDWPLPRGALRNLRGADGPIRFSVGLFEQWAFLYVEVADRDVVYASASGITLNNGPDYSDRVILTSESPPYLEEMLTFAAEAPGPVVTYVHAASGSTPEPTVLAYWQDVPGGYQLEARVPLNILGTHLGISVSNTSDSRVAGVQSASFSARRPGAFVTVSPDLSEIAQNLVQPGMRLIVTDRAGWRIASVGDLVQISRSSEDAVSNWLRIAYDALVEPGTAAAFAEPDASGREQQPYILSALDNERSFGWFRSRDSGMAIVAVAEPIVDGDTTIGAVVLQQGTDAILSLTNQGLSRLLNVTLIATLLVAAGLIGYASWLSRRIRLLSIAAERALDKDELRNALPSADSRDEIGDLSRSFSHVLRQLGDYNEYLRSLASKLSHELRTPLAIVTSSLENLEHEPLDETAADYTARAKDGAERLRRILSAMSEANRVEELMSHAEPEIFDLRKVLESTVSAYRDVYNSKHFEFDRDPGEGKTMLKGSPELIIQMLDKLVDNAADFTSDKKTITIALRIDDGMDDGTVVLSVTNPGPPLPERMRTQLFDSMVSVRQGNDDKHLGLGLYIARLIAEGHAGRIVAENTEDGVRFSAFLPRSEL